MTAQCEIAIKAEAGVPMSVFERYLTLWVFLCIVAGIVLGQVAPGRSRPSAAWRWPGQICWWACSSG